MNKHNLRFLRNEGIEEVTAWRIREYESKICTAVMLPVPVEENIEQVLGLDFDWDEIEEMSGEQILAGLVSRSGNFVGHGTRVTTSSPHRRRTKPASFLPQTLTAIVFEIASSW